MHVRVPAGPQAPQQSDIDPIRFSLVALLSHWHAGPFSPLVPRPCGTNCQPAPRQDEGSLACRALE
eukprot:15453310-Alexandrium_andersonii.AAC.1